MKKRRVKRYSLAFKQAVVREYEQGENIEDLRQKYGIGGGSTIQGWIEKYSREGLRHSLLVIQRPQEQNQVKELQAKIKHLEKAVAQLTVEKLVLESSLQEAEAQWGYELKKKPGQPSLSAPMAKPKSKAGRSR